MDRTRICLAFFLLFLLPGCAGPAASGPSSGTLEGGQEPTGEASGSLSVAEPRRLAVDWGGSASQRLCLPDGQGCSGPGLPGQRRGIQVIELDGNATSVEVRLAWAAINPTWERLALVVGRIEVPKGCDPAGWEGCYVFTEWTSAAGPSPLALHWQAIPGTTLVGIQVGPDNAFGPVHDRTGLYGMATVEDQPFRVTGNITYVPG